MFLRAGLAVCAKSPFTDITSQLTEDASLPAIGVETHVGVSACSAEKGYRYPESKEVGVVDVLSETEAVLFGVLRTLGQADERERLAHFVVRGQGTAH